MVKPEVLDSVPINVVTVREELAKINKRDGELNYRSKKTEEYVNYVNKMNPKKAKELHDAISKLSIPRIKETHINKFIDIMPVSPEDAKVLLQGQPISINNENLKKIVDVIDKFR